MPPNSARLRNRGRLDRSSIEHETASKITTGICKCDARFCSANQRDRLISEESRLLPAFLSRPRLLKPACRSLSLSAPIFFSLSRSRQLFPIGFIPPSALSRKASRFDALNRPFHWQSGYYETSQKILFGEMFSRS